MSTLILDGSTAFIDRPAFHFDLHGEIELSYGGWSLRELRDGPLGKRFMEKEYWYDECAWSREGLPPGTYHLHLAVADSNWSLYEKQEALLPHGQKVAPVVLVVTALLVAMGSYSINPLGEDQTHCREQVAEDDDHVQVGWVDSELCITKYALTDPGELWIASVKTSE